TPNLTARYSHRRLYDLAGAVEKLPSFLPAETGPGEAEALRATGTEGFGCSMVARTPGNQGHPPASQGTGEGGKEEGAALTQPLAVSPDGTSSHRRTPAGIEEAPPGFEPGMADLQSAALPLG